MKTSRQLRRDQAGETKGKILRAAVYHFSRDGFAGARTSDIAATAEVNSSLLFYYFQDKNGLYAAALEASSAHVMQSAFAALEAGSTPGEGLLRCSLDHFDRILTQRDFQRLLQQEMIRFRRGESGHFQQLAGSLFAPLLQQIEQTFRKGIRSGELLKLDWAQFFYGSLGGNVFYFLSAPIVRAALQLEPFENKAIAARRKAAMEFLGQAIFQDRRHGAQIARRVLAAMPMPRLEEPASIRIPAGGARRNP